MNLLIRPFENGDAEAVAEVLYASFKTYLGELLDKKDDADDLRKELASHDGDVMRQSFVAVADKCGIVGCIECTMLPRYRLGILERIGVSPEISGAGIGRKLFEEGMRFWRKHDARKIYTDVSSINPGAKRFYEKMGFSVEGMLKNHFFDGVDEYQMSLFLKPERKTAEKPASPVDRQNVEKIDQEKTL
ncbi:MAG: GNAT family N-acetyltransferase [Victivallaceae bacterium]|nr:GNAT family N-acetyltransferase [Victivallaceae bacterium]